MTLRKTALGMSLPHHSPDPLALTTLEAAGRDPTKFPVSKRAFMTVDERPAVARRELERWFIEVYPNPPGIDASGIHGTPEQVRERLEELVVAGAKHVLLEPDLPSR
jgi:alkanesulfonate monooxygenase SsuD/methylene tetrahydromethanopterin reductase-like flavin-dependent oxidoreductase (luciferase family)